MLSVLRDLSSFLNTFIFLRWILAINLFFCSVFLILISSILCKFLSVISFYRYTIACFTNYKFYECNFFISYYFLDHSRTYWSSINLRRMLNEASSEIGGRAF